MTALLLLVLLVPGLSLAAPRTTDRVDVPEMVLNPFLPGPEQLSLLQGYLRDEDPMEERTSDMKRETVILHLFVLHDFDKSGHLDGLELMRLVHGILATGQHEEPGEDSVIFLVDEILVKQDLNQDGLLSAQELVTPPITKAEESPPVVVAIPQPPGAHPGASDNLQQAQADPPGTIQADEQEVESKDNVEEKIPEQALPPVEEVTHEESAVPDHGASQVKQDPESEEVEEATDGEK